MRPVNAPATWVLSNHDVTRHTTRFANEPGLGTQIRLAGDRALGLRRARAASLLMLALPGSAYVYQGEELGLPDVVDLPDEVRQDPAYFRGAGQDGFRDGCRVPIPWTRNGSSYGFGDGGSWLPQPAEWGDLSIEAQTGAADSTLELYRTALSVRRREPGLGAGDSVEWLKAPEGVMAFRRGDFVCVANTTGEAVTIPAYGRVLLATAEVAVAGDEAKLPADTTVWWTTG
jgi:alpha-glucosidase